MNPQKSPSFPPVASPAPAWGSPALRPNASFPPTGMYNSTPPHRPPRLTGMRSAGPGTVSPQFQGMPFQRSFRTPQPNHSDLSPSSSRGYWSDGKGPRGKPYQQGNNSRRDSPRNSPSVNPGGSDNIQLYYSPAMMEDPWLDTPPKPVDYWKS